MITEFEFGSNMNSTLLFLFVCTLVFLFCLSAFFSASETAFFSLSPLQLRKIKNRHPKMEKTLNLFFSDTPQLLSTILVGNNLVNFAIGALMFFLMEGLVPEWSEILAIPLTTILLLLFGEITPKRFAINQAEWVTCHTIRPLRFFYRLFYPLSLPLTRISSSPLLKKTLLKQERTALNDDEIRSIVTESAHQGKLDHEEASLVDGIMRLSELKASDEMTPRIDIVGLDLDLPPEQWPEIVRNSNHTLLPYYRRSPDHIEGVLRTVVFLADPKHSIEKACITPLFVVPENIPLDKLLIDFQSKSNPFAVVMDEYGGVAGIITINDILEIISHPVRTTAQDEQSINRLNDTTWRVAGTTSLEEINRMTGLDLSADDADRISGWITFHLGGEIPKKNSSVIAQDCRVTVLGMRKHRIGSVLLERLNVPEENEDIEDFDELIESADTEEDA